MANRTVSMSERKQSADDETSTLPYLATHHKFPGRSNRLRAISQFRYIRVLNSSLRMSPRKGKESATPRPLVHGFRENTTRKRDTTFMDPADDSDAVDGTDSSPNSPTMAAWRGRATPILARKFFLPKYKLKW